jgi:hypothetical protein
MMNQFRNIYLWLWSNLAVVLLSLWLTLAGCQSDKSDQAPATADPETEAAWADSVTSHSEETAVDDSIQIAREQAFLAREETLRTPRQLTDYIPILADTLMGRSVPPEVARRVAPPLAKALSPDRYDIIDVLSEASRDLDGDRKEDRLFTLRYGPFDGNGRGLLTLVLISTSTGRYEAYATDSVWGREILEGFPTLNKVRVTAKTGRPYFTINTAKFPFTSLYLTTRP